MEVLFDHARRLGVAVDGDDRAVAIALLAAIPDTHRATVGLDAQFADARLPHVTTEDLVRRVSIAASMTATPRPARSRS